MQGLIDEKARLESEYKNLNQAHQQNIIEQNDLLALCSTYEDQLTTCRNFIQSAGLTVRNSIDSFERLFSSRCRIFFLNLITTNELD